jgi:hypothetical protein
VLHLLASGDNVTRPCQTKNFVSSSYSGLLTFPAHMPISIFQTFPMNVYLSCGARLDNGIWHAASYPFLCPRIFPFHPVFQHGNCCVSSEKIFGLASCPWTVSNCCLQSSTSKACLADLMCSLGLTRVTVHIYSAPFCLFVFL